MPTMKLEKLDADEHRRSPKSANFSPKRLDVSCRRLFF